MDPRLRGDDGNTDRHGNMASDIRSSRPAADVEAMFCSQENPETFEARQ